MRCILTWHSLVQRCNRADRALRTRLANAPTSTTHSTEAVPYDPAFKTAYHLNTTPTDPINSTSLSNEIAVTTIDTGGDIKLDLEVPSTSDQVNPFLNENEIRSDGQLSSMITQALTDCWPTPADVHEIHNTQYVCQMCRADLSHLSELTSHMEKIHPNETVDQLTLKEFIQNNIVFKETLLSEDSDRDQTSDSAEYEGPQSPTVRCPFCESMFSSPTRLIFHLNKHSEISLADGVSCCGITYTAKKALAQHLRERHALRPGATTTTCRSCGFRAADGRALRHHVAAAHACGLPPHETAGRSDRRESSRNQKFIPAVCPECNRTFSNKYNMFVHMKSHGRAEAKFPCDKCERSYSTRGNLAAHRRAAHEGALAHVCAHCGEAFPARRARDAHARRHSAHAPHACTRCPKAFRAADSLARHLEMHLDIRNFECQICAKRWNSYHFDGGPDPPGPDDGRSSDDEPLVGLANRKTANLYDAFYRALLNFKEHFSRHHRTPDDDDSADSAEDERSETDERPRGPAADASIDEYDDLSRLNMRRDRLAPAERQAVARALALAPAGGGRGRGRYACECGKRLGSAHTFLAHRRIHTGERPCVCHECGAQFRAGGALRRHLAAAHARRPRARPTCRLCRRSFANAQNLRHHARVHSGERPFACAAGRGAAAPFRTCEVCARSVARKSWRRHARAHAGERRHACASCGRAFAEAGNLRRHARSHAARRDHACAHCGRAFSRRDHLLEHARTHAAAREFVCHVCGAASRSAPALRMHLRTHRPRAPKLQDVHDSSAT
ncbi:hypothetical protein ACJJTC_005282 [Scirpophaga incertulas]